MPNLTHDGVELSYRVVGDGERDLVVVHGWMVSGTVFDELVERFDDGNWRIVVPDLRGAGESSPADSYRLEDYAGDVLAVMDDAGVDQACLVGHSMGGQIAQLVAADHPGRIRRLALISPVPASGIELPEDAHRLFVDSGEDRASQRRILEMACLDLADEDYDRLLDDAGAIPEQCIRESFAAWTEADFADRLGAIEAPTLVVGSDDPFLPPELLDEAVVGPIADAELTRIEGAGHYIQVERPDETARVLRDFFGADS